MGAVVPFDPKTVDYESLPDIASAKLPINYEQAKVAIAECWHLDQVQDWADKSAALAAYARMSGDEELEKLAMRIRARAIRKCGELLEQVKSAQGKNGKGSAGDSARVSEHGRFKAGEIAGLSFDQTRNAIRVARVPAAEFEQQVESETPPSIQTLAKQGTRHKPEPPLPSGQDHLAGRTVAEFQAAGKLIGALRFFVTETRPIDLGLAFRGLADHEREQVADFVDKAADWLSKVSIKGGTTNV